jgi:hypothetical protein
VRPAIIPNPRKAAIWRAITLCGGGLVVIGIGAFLGDSLSVGRIFSLFNDNYELFLFAIAFGTLVLVGGLIGWFKYLNQSRRSTMGLAALGGPIVVSVIGGLVGTTNVHGPFFLIVIPMLPVALLGLVLLVVALASRGG